jgi:hypothetical protein
MKVNGSCHCGEVTFEAEVDPERVSICHCTDCQVLTGTAYRVSVASNAGTFRLLSGSPTAYLKTTAESGNKRLHSFCATCGSPLYVNANEDNPQVRNLRVGVLAQREQLPPRRRIWCRSALSWSEDISALPGTAKQ